ncbi:helix-turn-helix domain-containing protein [Vibrio mediterranei]|uniref:helix-turn-helix domain-containing protein n=1 Tax=Vibrio mediterranei TaxID=689 RepID=UPI0040681FB0
MTTLITRDEVIQFVKQERELKGIVDQKHAAPDFSQLLPELKFVIVEALLLHTRGNQALAARMLGINRGTLRKISQQGFKDGSYLLARSGFCNAY